MTRRSTLAVLVALTTLAAPASALADKSQAIFDECQEGKITGTYSQKDYATALRTIPTDLDEYTDCRDEIRRAQLGSAGGSSSGGGGTGDGAAGAGGGGVPPTTGGTAAQLLASASPAERRAVDAAVDGAGAAKVDVGGEQVTPDAAGFSPAGAANVVPTPLIVALVLVGLGLALAGTQTIRSRVLARRTPAT